MATDKNSEIKHGTRTYFKELRQLARLCKVTPSHLSHVLNGHRQSKKLTEKLKELGVTLAVAETQGRMDFQINN